MTHQCSSLASSATLCTVNRTLTAENCSGCNPVECSNAPLPLTMQVSLLSSIAAYNTKCMLVSALVGHDQNAQNLQDCITQGLFPLSLIFTLIFMGISLLTPIQAGKRNNLVYESKQFRISECILHV